MMKPATPAGPVPDDIDNVAMKPGIGADVGHRSDGANRRVAPFPNTATAPHGVDGSKPLGRCQRQAAPGTPSKKSRTAGKPP